MDLSFESETNTMRPLYANELTVPDAEPAKPDSLSPSPSTLDKPLPAGPSTPRLRERTTSQTTRSPVSVLAASITEGTPEWYLKKLQDKTLEGQHMTSLQNLLRGKDLNWVNHFVELRGMSVLAHRLYQLSQKKHTRRREDITTETDIVKCITYILNQKSALDIALSYNADLIVTHITSALNTPNLTTRRIILDVLVFLAYWNDGQSHGLVISALETLSEDNKEHGGCYTYWFKSLQAALNERGKSIAPSVTSSPQRRGSDAEATVTEYVMSNILLMNGIMQAIEDLSVRLHHRSLMEASGLQNIITSSRELAIATIDKQLDLFQQTLDDDQGTLDTQNKHASCNLSSVEEVFNVLRTKTGETKASTHFLSILQHLLLIPEDTPDYAVHFQLVDNVVADVIMDAKLGRAEKRLGLSVERVVAQMNKVERTQQLEEDLVKARSDILELKVEKDGLVDRLEQSEQMIMSLQTIISRLDGQLSSPRPEEHAQAEYEKRLSQLAAHAQVEPPRGLFQSPLGEHSKSQSGDKVSEPSSASATSPPASKLNFWGISAWFGTKHAASDSQSTQILTEDEKAPRTSGAVAA